MYWEIIEFLKKNNIAKFRIKQLDDFIFLHKRLDLNVLNQYPKSLRENLIGKFDLDLLKIEKKIKSEDTIKFLFKTKDNQYIETVLMLHKNRNTVCVSSQINCPLNCKFCATGAQKFIRNLSYWEIVLQILKIEDFLRESNNRVNNVVFMGMGEPFLNYDNVVSAIKILNEKNNIGARHITVSTVGIANKIRDLSGIGLQVRLAVSLHFANDELRDEIMPINKKYDLKELFKSIDFFQNKMNKRVSFEYVLIKGVNDKISDAKDLVNLLKGRNCFVNLLVFNEHDFSGFKKPNCEDVAKFKDFLERNGLKVAIRKSLGLDSVGACGQLSGKK